MNTPNALVLSRVLASPLLFALLVFYSEIKDWGLHESWINYFCSLIFGLAALSDFFDGFVARAWQQSTKLGEILDPLADKMLILAALLGLMLLGRAEAFLVYLILIREFFITGFRVVLVSEGLSVKASIWGKLKTTAQMIAMIFLFMDWVLGSTFFYICFALTMYSGWEYVASYLKAKREG